MKMILNILSCDMGAATPEIKLFLMRYLHNYGLNDGVRKTVKELSRELGVSDRLVTCAMSFLITNEYLRREQSKTHRGRPASIFHCCQYLRDLLEPEAGGGFNSPHRHLIKLMAGMSGGESRKSAERDQNDAPLEKLSLSSRFLLCVLLANSDSFGLVRNLNSYELAKAAGLSTARLRRHIKLLSKAGYLTYFPGVVVRQFIGRLPSVYRVALDWGTGNQPLRLEYKIYPGEFLFVVNRIFALISGVKSEVGDGGVQKSLRQDGHTWLNTLPVDMRNLDNIIILADFFSMNSKLPVVRRLNVLICELLTEIWMRFRGANIFDEDVKVFIEREVEERFINEKNPSKIFDEKKKAFKFFFKDLILFALSEVNLMYELRPSELNRIWQISFMPCKNDNGIALGLFYT